MAKRNWKITGAKIEKYIKRSRYRQRLFALVEDTRYSIWGRATRGTEIFPVSVQMSVLSLSPGRRFSVCGNGIRRTCAVVKLETENVIKMLLKSLDLTDGPFRH